MSICTASKYIRGRVPSQTRAFVHGYQYFINQIKSTNSNFKIKHYKYIQKVLAEAEEEDDAFIAKLEAIAATASEKAASKEAARLAEIASAATNKLVQIEDKLRTYQERSVVFVNKESEMKEKLRKISVAAAKKAAKLEEKIKLKVQN